MTSATMTSLTAELDRFAEALAGAHETGTRFLPIGPVPDTPEAALALQEAVMARFEAVGGFKVADKPDMPFVMAPIRADRVFQSGSHVPIIDKAGIELEVGFEIVKPIRPGADLATIATCVWPRPVIEVVDTRIDGPLADDPIVKLADMQANSALVVGARAPDWDGTDFGTVTAQLTYGATTVVDGKAMVPGGSGLEMVAKLAARLGAHCGGLQRGQFVITGSLNGLPYFPAGETVHGQILNLGVVEFHLSR